MCCGCALTGAPDLDVPEPAEPHGGPVPVADHQRPPAPVRAPAGPAADDWLTALLAARSGWSGWRDPTRRPVAGRYAEPDDRVSFADGYPLLLANAASLDALNEWLRQAGHPRGRCR